MPAPDSPTKNTKASLVEEMKWAPFDGLGGLVAAWVRLEAAGPAGDDRQRVQTYADLLRLPLMVGPLPDFGRLNIPGFPSLVVNYPWQENNGREVLLKGLEAIITNQTFDGDLWRFVDWATKTEPGRALQLDLGE